MSVRPIEEAQEWENVGMDDDGEGEICVIFRDGGHDGVGKRAQCEEHCEGVGPSKCPCEEGAGSMATRSTPGTWTGPNGVFNGTCFINVELPGPERTCLGA